MLGVKGERKAAAVDIGSWLSELGTKAERIERQLAAADRDDLADAVRQMSALLVQAIEAMRESSAAAVAAAQNIPAPVVNVPAADNRAVLAAIRGTKTTPPTYVLSVTKRDGFGRIDQAILRPES